jgi:cytoskeletal protein CcmA (bactofilin family)
VSLRGVVGFLAVLAGVAVVPVPAGAAGITVRLAGDIVVPPGEIHDGSAVAVHGRVRVEGTLRGDAIALNGDVEVWGWVTGSVRVVNGRVVLGSAARVDGDVWVANGQVARSPGARVGGRILQGQLGGPPPTVRRPLADAAGRMLARVAALWVLVGSATLAAAVAALFPAPVSRIASTLSTAPGASLVAGVLLWALLPPLGLVLAVSIVGIPLLALLPFALSLLALVGLAGIAVLVGHRLTEAFRWTSGPVGDAVVGAVILALLPLLPGPGRLAFVLALAWGMGAGVLVVIRRAPAPTASSSSEGC